MSKYTTEVRYICETYAQLNKSEGYQSINGIIEKARDKIFNFDFPIYDESYRGVLESKILKHYYTREIGFETVGLWEHFLDMKMNEIMPYYNQLYKSALLNFNPLYDVDYTTTSNRNIGSDEKSTTHNTRTDNLDESTSFDNTRTDNLKEATSFDNTRTDNLDENITETDTRTDNLKEQNVNNNTRTDNLSSKYDDKAGTEYGHVVDTTNTMDADSSDRYSETPQGSLQGLTDLTYLTNARMKTDSNTGTGKESHSGVDSTYDDSTTLNTGTQKNEGGYTTDNTGTQQTKIDRDKSNTGTQNEAGSGSKDNTGTQTQAGTGNKKNTGTQDNDANGTKNFNSTDEYLEHVAGKKGTASYSELIQEYRKTFLNIDMMVINELADLFMNLW